MKKLLFAVFLLFLGCGEDGQNGGRGPMGPAGNGGSNGRDGDDGKPGQPGEPGKPGEQGPPGEGSTEVVSSVVKCSVVGVQTDSTTSGYPKFDLYYDIVILKDGSFYASMKEMHYFRAGSDANVTTSAMFFIKGAAGYDQAMVESTMWRASIVAPKKAEFKYKPGAFVKQVVCQ